MPVMDNMNSSETEISETVRRQPEFPLRSKGNLIVIVSRGDAEDAELTGTGLSLDQITGEIVDAALRLHRSLGPGLLESVYEAILFRDLTRHGLIVERQKAITFDYDGLHFEDGFRIDLLVAGMVVVEIKSLERLLPVHQKQVLTYFAASEIAGGPPYQLWCVDPEGRPPSHCKRS